MTHGVMSGVQCRTESLASKTVSDHTGDLLSDVLSMRQMLAGPGPVRLMGAHDGLTAILAQKFGFEAIWAGGLGISTAAGVPDAGLLTMSELLEVAVAMRRVVDIPII